MKTKRLQSKLTLMLNKKTISNLGHQEMVKVGAGADYLNGDNPDEPETDLCGDYQPSPRPMDVGVPPEDQASGESKTSYC